MAWYDWFARIYDDSLQALYAQQRLIAIEALQLRPGLRVLDVPTGTGASLPALAQGVGETGAIIGVDLSQGMLRRAQARVAAEELGQVTLLCADAGSLDAAALGHAQVDRLHVFLGMSVFPAMDATFANLWSLLSPGGRCVIVDVHSEQLGLHGKLVNWTAQADIRRRFWEPLHARAQGFELRDLPHNPKHGGQIMLASGDKPGP